MKIYEVKERKAELIQSLCKIWEASVRATHLFLSDEEIQKIAGYVPSALNEIPHLVIAENDSGKAIAFMGVAANKLEMLFIAPEERGKGLGKKLIQFAFDNYAVNEVCVNEQNPQARGFYEHCGFRVYKRSELDAQGAPYPLLYMKL